MAPSGRYALIVANSNYRDPKLRKLRSPAIDARRLAAVLTNPNIGGFQVGLALDEEEPQLRRQIGRFFSDRRPDDLLLVHFSCHGVKDDSGELYLAAKDTELGSLLSTTGISTRWLNEQIGRSRSKRVVILLDCCFSGAFPFNLRPRAGEAVNVGEHLEGLGRAVITASSSMEYSYEGNELTGRGRPSVFTEAVVEALETGKADQDGDKWISVDELYEYVYARVKARTPSQSPNKLSSLEGPLYIARSRYEPPLQPAALPPELIALIQNPLTYARLGAIEELAKLLKSNDPAIVLAARHALKPMLDDDSQRVSTRARQVLAAARLTETPEPPDTLQREPYAYVPAGPASLETNEPDSSASLPKEKLLPRLYKTVVYIVCALAGFAASVGIGFSSSPNGWLESLLAFFGMVCIVLAVGVWKHD
jgi:Caspase domain